MALANAPFGFRPLRHLSGGNAFSARQYPIATGYSTALYPGDPVKALSDGTIALAAAADRILGIFMGCQYTAADGSAFFGPWAASTTATNIKAAVIVDPNVTFEVQSGGTPAQTNVFNMADHVTGTGNAYTNTSAAYLNSSMGTADKGFRILGIVDKPGNSGQYATLEVQIFQGELSRDDAATPGV